VLNVEDTASPACTIVSCGTATSCRAPFAVVNDRLPVQVPASVCFAAFIRTSIDMSVTNVTP
jgi:hypothetical protein